MWRSILVLVPLMMVACSGDGEEEAPVANDCSDPAYNPWAGTCVETFNADCFDPAGACVGEIDFTSGGVNLEWENGAGVETSINVATLGATTDLISSSGAVCSTGESQNLVGGCASQTIYTRTSDGAQMTFCIYDDQSMDVTCPDGTVHSAPGGQQGATDCQYGSDGEACVFDDLPTQ